VGSGGEPRSWRVAEGEAGPLPTCHVVLGLAFRRDIALETGFAQRERALDDVAQLVHVAGPVVAAQIGEQALRERDVAAPQPLHEVAGQHRDVRLALAQRRHLRGHHCHAVARDRGVLQHYIVVAVGGVAVEHVSAAFVGPDTTRSRKERSTSKPLATSVCSCVWGPLRHGKFSSSRKVSAKSSDLQSVERGPAWRCTA
jgi:hypothetical protein